MTKRVIDVKQLRASLASVVRGVREGARITVTYGSRPLFEIVPLASASRDESPLETDPLFRAKSVGRSRDGRPAADHDAVLYGER